MSKVHARSHKITNKPLRVRPTKTCNWEHCAWLPTWKTNYNAEKCASDVKKMKNRRKQNFEGDANNMQLDKEDTRRSNWKSKCFFFNILILLFVFITFNKLTCKVRFHIAVWSRSKCHKSVQFHWKLSSNQRKTNRFPAKFAREALTKSAVLFTNRFSVKLASKIPAKFPQNRPFFLRICPRKSREIWLFLLQPTRSPACGFKWHGDQTPAPTDQGYETRQLFYIQLHPLLY